jgi:hypothetical protein
MPTIVVYSGTDDGYIYTSDASYANTRSGTGLTAHTTETALSVGQDLNGTYEGYEGFLSFDTSAIPNNATITNVELGMYGSTDNSTQDFTVVVKAYDWGTSLTTADYVAGASLTGLGGAGTELLLYTTLNGWSTSAYNICSDGGAVCSAINKSGITRFILYSDRFANNNTPTTFEQVQMHSGNQTGTERRPKLTITYTEVSQSLTGSMGTLSGTLARQINKPLAGAASTLSGILNKRVPLAFAGTMGALTGAFSQIRAIPITITGTMGSLSGSISRQVRKVLGSPLTMAGVLTRQGMPMHLSGAVGDFTGVLNTLKVRLINLTGAINPSGAVTPLLRGFRYAIMKAGSVAARILRGGSAT